ncbi:RNA polymerase sigma-70 region 2 domain-containing protein OS=Streptomyces chartreusis OX=1969 GN=HUT05_45230 PE=4 SV=1 [Streptomyces chartreusis]|nr:DNA-directed RNA polymerase specialized sigma subunit, sigma24 family [Streptomyces sp. PAN_FS17]
MALNDAQRSLVQQFMQGDQEVRKRIVGQLDGPDRTRSLEAERVLVACMRQGDWTAWNTLLGRFGNGLMSVAWQRLGRRQPAEDVVFDAFYELAMTGKEIKSVRGWLRTYVDRRAVSAYRRSWREVWAADPHELMPVLQGSPAEQAEGELAARRTWQDVKRLLTPEEQLLITRLADGARASDEAARLGISLHAYEKRRQRACRRARAVLRVLRMWPQERRCAELDRIFTEAEKRAVTKQEWLTQSVVDKVTQHLEKDGQSRCRSCERQEKQHASLRLPYEGLLIFAPSPELRERMQQVCSKVRLGHQKKMQTRQNTDTPTGGARRTVTRRYTPPPSRGAFAGGPRPVPRRRPARRVAKAAGAALLASLITLVLTDQSGAGISLPSLRQVPGVGAFAGPGGHEQADGDDLGGGSNGTAAEGGNAGRAKGGDGSGRDHDGTAGGGNDRREDSDRSNGGTGSGRHGDGGDGDSGGDSTEENGGDGIDGDEGGGDGEIRLEEGEVVAPQEDTTGPGVSLAGISTSAVGQEVVDHHGSLMQTCGPGGTPTTYSVWVAASDPSGIYLLTLSIEHPTDGTYESSAGVTDGDAVRFDIPAYRTGPKALETVQLHLTARAKDTNGNRTDADLGTLPLYECGEPG